MGSSIVFHLKYYDKDKEIIVHLDDSLNTNNISYVKVRGDDSIWANGIFSKLVQSINTFEKQSSFARAFRWPLSVLLGILGAYPVAWLSTLFIPQTEKFRGSVFGLVYIAALFTIGGLLADYFSKLWPDIEIVPEPPHEKILFKRREQLKYVITVIIIPFIISAVVSFLIK
jgi:hypothetical protein